MHLHSFLTHGLFLCSLAGMGYGGFWLLRRQEDGSRMLTQGKLRMAWLVIPGLLNLMLFYSLAFHMHQSLGKFPEVIGDRGFTPNLKLHADCARGYFGYLFFFTIFAWPLLLILGARIKALKSFFGHVAAVGLSFWVSFALTFLSPSGFINWWWD